ncbi:MAG TPA: 6-phosphogluconolactonase [Nordella sp.]|nr:6-phosphogluconolactonase [Nordella sp.]
MIVERKLFETKKKLALGLAADVAACLSNAITDRGTALLAVSGGTTPTLFFNFLARVKIDWARVTITLVDERCVPESDERSNARLVRENLLEAEAAAAKFVPLFGKGHAERLGPFDAVILGMGNDGHTASFFPGGDNLAAALELEGTRRIMTMSAPGIPEKRLTFTLPVLLDSGFIALHIEGAEKQKVLAAAEGPGPVKDMPIRAVLRAREPVVLYWCP